MKKKTKLILMLCVIFIFIGIGQTAFAKTREEAIAWVKSKSGQQIGSGQCVALISEYYRYLGVSPVSGNGCDYATNALPSGWTREKGGVPQKGDILVYTGGYGHVAIAESTTVGWHQNWGSMTVQQVTRNYNAGYTYNGTYVSYWGVIRPAFTSADTTKPTINSVTITDITEKSYKVNVNVSDDVGIVRVWYPTWTKALNQADKKDYQTYHNSKLFSTNITVPISDFANKTGTYCTHVYAYDNAGNVGGLDPGNVYIGSYQDLGTSFYAVIKVTSSGLALTGSSTIGTQITANTYTGAKNQIWLFTKQSDKSYEIKNLGTGLCFDLYGGYAQNNNKVDVYTDNDSNAQRWFILSTAGSYRLRCKSAWQVLDVDGGGTASGTKIGIYSSNDTNAQKFTITKLVAATPVITPSNNTGDKSITISCATSGAAIYYTTDGSTPTTSSTKYTAPFKISQTATIKAIAAASGYTNSTVASKRVEVVQIPISKDLKTTSTITTGSGFHTTTVKIDNPKDAALFEAIYDSNGFLLDTAKQKINSSSKEITIKIPANAKSAYAKVFVWESENSMKPAMKSETIKIN